MPGPQAPAGDAGRGGVVDDAPPAGGAGRDGGELGAVDDVLDAAGAGRLPFGAGGLGADVLCAVRVCAAAFWIPRPPLIALPTPTPTPTSATAPNSADTRRQSGRRTPDFNLDILPPFDGSYVLNKAGRSR